MKAIKMIKEKEEENKKQKNIKKSNIEKIQKAEKDLFKIFFKKINNFIEDNKEEYELVHFCEEDFYFMIVKKTNLLIKDVNLNNPFQPYECMSKRDYPIVSIVRVNYKPGKPTTAYKDPIFIENIRKFGGKVLRLNLRDNFEEKMREFFA
jgi:hypothetical protein